MFDMGQGKRLPAATEYTLTVPAGIKSQSGNALAAEQKLTMRTPTVQLIRRFPEGGEAQPLQPVIWLGFDQAIDPDAVAKTVKLVGNGKTFAVRMATVAERNSSVYRYWGSDLPRERMLALRPVRAPARRHGLRGTGRSGYTQRRRSSQNRFGAEFRLQYLWPAEKDRCAL
ncbi:MAG: Ig-like domain-containing protein [Armatimonas sp.]